MTACLSLNIINTLCIMILDIPIDGIRDFAAEENLMTLRIGCHYQKYLRNAMQWNNTVNFGWQCPACGKVYNPLILQCFNCHGNVVVSEYPPMPPSTTPGAWPTQIVPMEKLREQYPEKYDAMDKP
jgi:hypothetical protein